MVSLNVGLFEHTHIRDIPEDVNVVMNDAKRTHCILTVCSLENAYSGIENAYHLALWLHRVIWTADAVFIHCAQNVPLSRLVNSYRLIEC